MFGPVILPLDQAVTAIASAERLAQAGVSAEEVRARTDMHVYSVARDAAGTLVVGHASHASHASHVSSVGGGGIDYGTPTTTVYPDPTTSVYPDPTIPVLTVPAAPAAVAATAQDGAADVSWAPVLSSGSSTITYTVTAHPGLAEVTVVNGTVARFDGLQNGIAYSFTVTATNSAGQGPASVASVTVVPVAPQLEAHVPLIVGEPAVRRPLEVVATGWAEGTTLSYQWQADGLDIVGATGTTFHPTADLVGERISVALSGTNPAYALGGTSTSARTVKVARVGTASVTGKARVGSVLHAHTGRWTSGTRFRFTWLVGGKRVRHSGPDLPVKPAYTGKSIAVRVTGSKRGYDTFIATSSRTSRVRG